jgi:hypothetical protein
MTLTETDAQPRSEDARRTIWPCPLSTPPQDSTPSRGEMSLTTLVPHYEEGRALALAHRSEVNPRCCVKRHLLEHTVVNPIIRYLRGRCVTR